MRLIFHEKFVDAEQKDGEYFEVFSSPTSKEMNEVSRSYAGTSKAIRFLADNQTRTLYVFDPNYLHSSAIDLLGLPRDDKRYLRGTAEMTGGTWVAFHVSFFLANIVRLLKQDWSWVNKWINVEEYIESRLEDIDEV